MNLKIFAKNLGEKAMQQIELLVAQEPFADKKIRIMPDAHAGAGCVIGFTGDLGEMVIPNIVGVDLNCGMLVVPLGNIPMDLKKLDEVIYQFVPSGFEAHEEVQVQFDMTALKSYMNIKNKTRLVKAIGTLGGGNHFIEIDIDENENKYLVIHTGSRNLGKQVAEHYQALAIKTCMAKPKSQWAAIVEKLRVQYSDKKVLGLAINAARKEFETPSIPSELCFLTDNLRDNYLHDVNVCKDYADLNRQTIANIIMREMGWKADTHEASWTTVHNYIDQEMNIIRKGAISARKGEKLIIPLNMRDGCIIGVGKGNDDWNQSAPHGAGRILSRGQARDQLSLADYQATMQGIYSTSISPETLDEAPFAYKPSQEIIDAITPTVDILKIIKPIYNYKAQEKKREGKRWNS